MGRVIVITGASGDIAQKVVEALPDTDHLILLGRDKVRLDSLYRNKINSHCYALDLRDEVAVASRIDQIYRDFGRVDILLNNAGYATYKDFDCFSMSEIRDMFDINTFASMQLCNLIGGRMKVAGSGHIINLVSMSGYMATGQSSIYSASKFAMIGYSDTLRLELSPHKVWVTTINPGPVATKFFETADPTGNYLESVRLFTLKPEQVAKKIIAIMGKKKRQLNMPFVLNLAHKIYTLFPTISDFLARTVFNLKK